MPGGKKDVAVQDTSGLPAELFDEVIANAGAGLSQETGDNIVPFIALLQDMSPEVKKRDPNYVEGAEAGMYLNRATRQLWAGDDVMAERTGLPILEFQHCFFDHCVVEWIPRQEGGGFVARHPLQGTVEDTMSRLGGRQVRDPQDPNKMIWKSGDGSHDLIDTRYHFGNVVGNGSAKPAVLAFSSTGHTASRQWMTTMNEFMVKHPQTGAVYRLPAWMRKYKIGSKPRENKKGSFFVTTVADGGLIEDPYLREQGKFLHDGAKAGTITASTDEGTSAGVSDAI